jgi:hypothetical protein
MSTSPLFCPAIDTCLPQTATVAWNVTRQARLARHEAYRAGTCRGPAPFGHLDPTARLPREDCAGPGCIDLFMDVWLHAHTAMHAKFGDLTDSVPGTALAYFAASARSQLQEIGRRQRAERGGVAKPQRADGTIGRVARSLADPWLAQVFRFLLGYAARAELRADVEACLALVRQGAGDAWLYECILLPLANRGGLAPLPAELACASSDDAGLEDAATSMLQELMRQAAAGTSPQNALRVAVQGWLGDDPCPPEWTRKQADDLAMRRLAMALIAELSWHQEAA